MSNVRNWGSIRYFSSKEFDSPDLPGSGRAMKHRFVKLLNEARGISGVPFHINSGVRTPEHNKKVGGAKYSSHLTGWAADIRVTSNSDRRKILNALIKVGLNKRIGLAETFIHVDCDPSKSNSYWTYGSKPKGLGGLIKSLFTDNKVEDI